MVYVVGDSHARELFAGHNEYDNHKVGTWAAFRLHTHHEEFVRHLNGHEHDKIIVVFGEIDVREHIVDQAKKQNRTTDELVDDTAFSFVEYISSLCYDISILSVPPTGDGDDDKVFRGTYEERKHITERLNARYEYYCGRFNVPFVNVYKYLVDENGDRRKELVVDQVHLGCIADIINDRR